MTQKERKLGMIAGGMFAVVLAYMVIQRLLVGPIVTLRNDVTTMQAERDRLAIQARSESTLRRLWSELAARTLASEKVVATGRLDQLVKSLLSEAGLERFRVNCTDIKPSKDKLYAVIPCTVVGAEGDMQAVARFLHKFYRQPHAMQITGFSLEPVTYRKGSTLRFSSLVIEALMLPTEGLPASLVSAAKPVASSPSTRPAATNATLVKAPASAPNTAVPGRSKDTDLQAYAILWEKKFMEPWQQPPPPPPPPPGRKQEQIAMPTINPGGGQFTGPMDVRITCNTPGVTIRYTTDGTDPNPSSGQIYSSPVHLEAAGTIKAIAYVEGPEKRSSGVAMAAFSEPPPPPMRVAMLVSEGDPREVILHNEQTKQSQIVQEGEPLDGGTLVAVLPQAAVVQMPDGPMYVYRLGKGFAEKEVLDQQRQPDVWSEVKELVEPQS